MKVAKERQKTREELLSDNLELATALSMLLSASSNREAVAAVQLGKSALEKHSGSSKSIES